MRPEPKRKAMVTRTWEQSRIISMEFDNREDMEWVEGKLRGMGNTYKFSTNKMDISVSELYDFGEVRDLVGILVENINVRGPLPGPDPVELIAAIQMGRFGPSTLTIDFKYARHYLRVKDAIRDVVDSMIDHPGSTAQLHLGLTVHMYAWNEHDVVRLIEDLIVTAAKTEAHQVNKLVFESNTTTFERTCVPSPPRDFPAFTTI